MSSFWNSSLAVANRAFAQKFLILESAMTKLTESQQRSKNKVLVDEIIERDWYVEARDFAKYAISLSVAWFVATRFARIIENTLRNGSDRDGLLAAKKQLAKRLNRPEIETMDFDSYEMRLMVDVLGPDELDVTFDDVGGLESQLEDVKDNVVLPIRLWAQDRHSSVSGVSPCPTGVILYGKPGTGKSLIAKAIAKECSATFINIKASSLLDKWLGESDKLATALFKLARKLSPSIIFIDEVETLLRKRGGGSGSDNHAVVSMQGVFLAEWDGLQTPTNTTSNDGPVLLLGATNRLDDIDSAFQRRFPVKIATTMPDTKQRVSILRALLKKEPFDESVNLQIIAQATEGSSGSDLRELVRLATLNRTKEMRADLLSQTTTTTKTATAKGNKQVQQVKVEPKAAPRPLNVNDFRAALTKIRASAMEASHYNQNQRREDTERLSQALNLFFDQQQQKAAKQPAAADDEENTEDDNFHDAQQPMLD